MQNFSNITTGDLSQKTILFTNQRKKYLVPQSPTNCLRTPYLRTNYKGGVENTRTSPSWNTNNFTKITLHLLRKEYVYTKLKYSRSPAFDIVSGGSAALLAAFFGFLISEKFGIELVDSGDFYYLNMYLIIFAYSLKTFKDVICVSRSLSQFFMLSYLVDYFKVLLGWLVQLVQRCAERLVLLFIGK